jgi:hypothetical protein
MEAFLFLGIQPPLMNSAGWRRTSPVLRLSLDDEHNRMHRPPSAPFAVDVETSARFDSMA